MEAILRLFRPTLVMIAVLAALPVDAASPPKIVSTSRLKQTTVRSGGKRVKTFCLGSVPGAAKAVSGGMRFTSFAYTLSKTPLSRRSERDRLRALSSSGVRECKRLQRIPTPTPVPIGNFDNDGNVTDLGRAIFGIPAGLPGNISTGRSVYTTKCVGCHVERTNYGFPEIRTAIARPPMLFDDAQIPNDQLSHLIAYLNRFRQ